MWIFPTAHSFLFHSFSRQRSRSSFFQSMQPPSYIIMESTPYPQSHKQILLEVEKQLPIPPTFSLLESFLTVLWLLCNIVCASLLLLMSAFDIIIIEVRLSAWTGTALVLVSSSSPHASVSFKDNHLTCRIILHPFPFSSNPAGYILTKLSTSSL